MSTPRAMFAAVSVGSYIYALGGLGNGTVLTSTERALIHGDGSLGPWTAATPLIAGRRGHAAVAVGNHIYVLGYGDIDLIIPYSTSVDSALVNVDGSLGPWQTETPMLVPRSHFAAAALGSYLYAFGGQNGSSAALDSVERAFINPDGSLASWVAETPMLVKRCFLAGVAVNGYLNAIGGSNCQGTFHGAEHALIGADGALGNWEPVVSPLVSRHTLAAAASSDFVYIAGGVEDDSGSALNTVEYIAADALLPPPDYGLSINDGALFTNQVAVTLTISARPGTTQMQVSNDGGFAGAVWEAFVEAKAWSISQFGNYVIPRVVYVRFRDAAFHVSATFQDDIILDVTPPSGSVQVQNKLANLSLHGAGLPRVTVQTSQVLTTYLPLIAKPLTYNAILQLTAQDDVSGVASVLVSNTQDFAGAAWEPFAAAKPWYFPPGESTVYVKFRDNAGNISPVSTGSLPP